MNLFCKPPLPAWWFWFPHPGRRTPPAHLDERALRDVGLHGLDRDQLQRLGVLRIDPAAARIETPFRVRRSVL